MFPQANSPSATAQTRKVNRINDNHQQIASATTSMKRLLFLAISAFSISAYALPTYEPFTEFAPTIASNSTNLFVRTNGVSMGTSANSSILNCLDLATGGYNAPSGEH